MLIGQFSKCPILQLYLQVVVRMNYLFIFRHWENWFKSKELLKHSGGLEVSTSALSPEISHLSSSMSPAVRNSFSMSFWNLVSPLRSLVDHSVTRMGWSTWQAAFTLRVNLGGFVTLSSPSLSTGIWRTVLYSSKEIVSLLLFNYWWEKCLLHLNDQLDES